MMAIHMFLHVTAAVMRHEYVIYNPVWGEPVAFDRHGSAYTGPGHGPSAAGTCRGRMHRLAALSTRKCTLET